MKHDMKGFNNLFHRQLSIMAVTRKGTKAKP